MATKVGINGFGRIGRLVLRAILDRYPEDLEVVAINDLFDTKTNAHLFAHDSTFGAYPGEVSYTKDAIIVDGKEIKAFAVRNPEELPWGELGVDVELKPMLFNQQWELAKSDPPNAQDVFLLLYWPTYSDAGADNLWSMFHSSEKPFFNLSYWKNEKFDQLVDDAIAKTVTDPETAQQEYIEAMNLLVDEAPGLFFFDTMAIFIIPNYIEGFQYNLNYPFVQYFFYDLYTE
jgi:ABC-type oligopeptide transport system substrate-binding subunit